MCLRMSVTKDKQEKIGRGGSGRSFTHRDYNGVKCECNVLVEEINSKTAHEKI